MSDHVILVYDPAEERNFRAGSDVSEHTPFDGITVFATTKAGYEHAEALASVALNEVPDGLAHVQEAKWTDEVLLEEEFDNPHNDHEAHQRPGGRPL